MVLKDYNNVHKKKINTKKHDVFYSPCSFEICSDIKQKIKKDKSKWELAYLLAFKRFLIDMSFNMTF